MYIILIFSENSLGATRNRLFENKMEIFILGNVTQIFQEEETM